MAAIILNRVDFHYEDPYNEVFQDLSLVMDTRWRAGLVGVTGVTSEPLQRPMRPPVGRPEPRRRLLP